MDKESSNYVIEKYYLPRLRAGGRRRKVYLTTTKHLQITIISTRRWQNHAAFRYELHLLEDEGVGITEH